jgi:hypothetical protein
LFTISEIPQDALGKRTLVKRGWVARDGDESHYVLEEVKYGRYCLSDGRECPAVNAVNEFEENRK